MIIGGQAVLFYGRPRLTQDVDVTLGVSVERLKQIEELCHRLGMKFLVKDTGEFVKRTCVFPTYDPKSKLRVDFIFSNTPYERQAIQRSVAARIGTSVVRMASLEDLIIFKLVAGRAIDVEDVRTLLAKHPFKINFRYVRKWLKEFVHSEVLPHNPLLIFSRLLRAGRR